MDRDDLSQRPGLWQGGAFLLPLCTHSSVANGLKVIYQMGVAGLWGCG